MESTGPTRPGSSFRPLFISHERVLFLSDAAPPQAVRGSLMDTHTLERLLALSIRAAQSPAERILTHFADQRFSVESKQDGSPVTVADREAETMIRTLLRQDPFSANADVLGEEFGWTDRKTRYRWLIDPLDGTRSFVNRIPLFGTIIALQDRAADAALIGVIHLPVLNVTYSAARGLGCFRNGRPASVSHDARVDTSLIATGDIAQFVSAGCENLFHRLAGTCRYLRGYPDCFGHTLVISGSVGAMIDPAINPWEAVAAQALVEEAGGTMLTRPSMNPEKTDVLFGSPALVEQLAALVAF